MSSLNLRINVKDLRKFLLVGREELSTTKVAFLNNTISVLKESLELAEKIKMREAGI
jgi:hypothetical protein